ncbi:MAG: hypothetical protein QOI31_1739 [Solirubrobacterales bacterium]|jgi:RHS repeat-associated protein|nr:hypothetical protein [Solirubrobacterales bacterium]
MEQTSLEARETLVREHSSFLEQLDTDPGRSITDARVVDVPSPDTAVVDPGAAGGTKQLFVSSLPLVTEPEQGQDFEEVDLARDRVGETFAPADPAVAVRMPTDVSHGVQIPSLGLTVTPSDTGSVSSKALNNKDVFYANSHEDTDLVAAPLIDGVELAAQLRSPAAPEELEFSIDLPQDASMTPSEAGGYAITRGGNPTGWISPVVAFDAQGTSVDASYELNGSTLTIQVNHRDQDLAYPILVDPEFITDGDMNWWGSDTDFTAITNPGDAPLTDRTWYTHLTGDARVAGNTTFKKTCPAALISACTGSTPRPKNGLYIRLDPSSGTADNYREDDTMAWRYRAPGADTFISEVQFSHAWYSQGQTQPLQPYLFYALVDPDEDIGYVGVSSMRDKPGFQNEEGANRRVTYLKNIDPSDPDYNTLQSRDNYRGGNAAVFGFTVDPQHANTLLNSQRWAYVGGAAVTLDDATAPTVSAPVITPASATSSSTNPFLDNTTAMASGSAADGGLGVKEFSITGLPAGTSTSQPTRYPNNNCDGTRAKPCPANFQVSTGAGGSVGSSFGFPTGSIISGIYVVRFGAKDVTDNPATETPGTYLYIDHSKPQVTFTGGLSDGSIDKDYSLGFNATDGSPTGSFANRSSGVAYVQVKFDDEIVYTYDESCDEAPYSCPKPGSVALDPLDYPDGNVKIEVTVRDELGRQGIPGHEEKVSWTKTLPTSPVITGFNCHSDTNECAVAGPEADRWLSPSDLSGSDVIETAVHAKDPFFDQRTKAERGVKRIVFYPADEPRISEDLDCPDGCPEEGGRLFEYSVDELVDGEHTFTAIAQDAKDLVSAPSSFDVRVDGTGPTFDAEYPRPQGAPVTPTLWEVSEDSSQAGAVAGLRYPLYIDAEDGSPTNPNSGVKSIEVQVDGRRRFFDSQPCDDDSCGMARTFKFQSNNEDPSQADPKTVTVIVTDHAGNQTTDEFDVKVTAVQEDRSRNGLETFFDYDSRETGVSGAHVNLDNGNAVWHKTPIINPGRGLASVVNLTYNSFDYPLGGDVVSQGVANGPDIVDTRFSETEYDEAGLGNSLGISGITRLNEPLHGVAEFGQTLSENPGALPAPPPTVTLTDPDGTEHTFTYNAEKSIGTEDANGDPALGIVYDPPPGVNLHLRLYEDLLASMTGPSPRLLPHQWKKAWAITRPDGVTYFFDGWGFATSIEDRQYSGSGTGTPQNRITFDYEYKLVKADLGLISGLNLGDVCDPEEITGDLSEIAGYVLGIVCEPRVKRVIDAAGSENSALSDERSIAVHYYDFPVSLNPTQEELHSAGKISKLVDHGGRELHFAYNGSGLLKSLKEAAVVPGSPSSGNPEARTTSFTYDQGDLDEPLAHPQLTKIVDPNANAAGGSTPPATEFVYADAEVDPEHPNDSIDRRAVSVTDRAGETRSYRYEQDEDDWESPFPADAPSAAEVTDARGNRSVHAVDTRGRMTSMVEPTHTGHDADPADTRRIELDWDDDNNVLRLTRAADSEDEASVGYTYNTNGVQTSQTDPLGRTTHFSYCNSNGTHRSEWGTDDDPENNQFVSDLIAFRKPAGNLWRFELDGVAWPTGVLSASGETYCAQLRANNRAIEGNPTAQLSPADAQGSPGEATAAYNQYGQVTEEINEAGEKTTYGSYDANGMPQVVTDPEAFDDDSDDPEVKTAADEDDGPHRWLYTYDDVGNLRSVTDPRGAGATLSPDSVQLTGDRTDFTTILEYDDYDRLVKEIVPKDSVSGEYITRDYTYDANGNQESVLDGANEEWTTNFTPMDRAQTQVNPLGEKTEYGYDAEQGVIEITSPRAFDAGDLPGTRLFKTRFELDAIGRPVAQIRQGETAADDLITSYAYDRRDNVVGVAMPEDNQAAASVQDAIANASDLTKQRWAYEFDPADELVAQEEDPGGINALSLRTEYRFDLNGNQVRVIDPRAFASSSVDEADYTWCSYFDDRDRPVGSMDPLGNRSNLVLDQMGRVTAEETPRGYASATEGDFTTRFAYDDNGKPVERTSPWGANDYGLTAAKLAARRTTFVLDEVGNPTDVTDPAGNLAFYRASQNEFTAHNQALVESHSFDNEFFDTGDLRTTTRPAMWRWDGPGSQLAMRESSANVGAAQGSEKPTSQGHGDLGEVPQQEMPGMLPMAGETELDYDGEMRLANVTDDLGSENLFAAGNTTTLGYDPAGRLDSVQRPLDSDASNPRVPNFVNESFGYDHAGNPTSLTDGEGKVSITEYDAFDRPVVEDLPGSGAGLREETELNYDRNGNLTSKVTPQGTEWEYDYDAVDRRKSETNPLDNSWTYGYDEAGNQTTSTTPEGRVSQTTFDSAMRPVAITEALGSDDDRSTFFELDPNGNRISIDAPGSAAVPSDPGSATPDPENELRRITTQSFDGRDLPWKRTTQTDLASDSDQLSDDQRTVVTEYDPNGNLRREVKPEGASNYAVDPGVPFTDGSGSLPDIADESAVVNATRNATIYEYSKDDIRTAIHLPWDGDSQDPDDNDSRRFRQDFELNARGWITSASSPYEWSPPAPENPEERVATGYTHFDTGWIKASTDPGLDPFEPEDPQGDDRADDKLDDRQAVAYEYDGRGYQTRWGTTTLEDGDVPSQMPDELRHVEREYFPSGMLAARKGFVAQNSSPARTLAYAYDANRRLVRIDDTEGSGSVDEVTAMRYDLADQLQVVDERGADDSTQTGAEPDTCYAYTQDGDLEKVFTDANWTAPTDQQAPVCSGYGQGKATSYEYDDLVREESVAVDMPGTTRDRTTTTSYWNSGEVLERTKSNGTAETYFYDADGQAAAKVRNPDGAGANTDVQDYEYDSNGNRLEDERGTYAYDSRDHLTSWTRPENYDRTGTVEYVTDGSGAIINETDPDAGSAGAGPLVTTETDYHYIGQRLISSTTVSSAGGGPSIQNYSYDDFGNLVRVYDAEPTPDKDLAKYQYDEFNRQVRAETGIGSTSLHKTETYEYDGLDRRSKKTEVGGDSHDYSYIGLTEQLASETEGGGQSAETRNYDYSSTGLRMGQESDAEGAPGMTFRPYSHDPQGTVLGLEDDGGVIDNDGSDRDLYQLDPYGNLENKVDADHDPEEPLSTEASDNPFRFQGHYYDSGVKSYDMKARSYLPELGRFMGEDRYEASGADLTLQQDPLTQNRYAFAGGNPISNVEWDGHRPMDCTGQCAKSFARSMRKQSLGKGKSAESQPSAPSPISPTIDAGLDELEARGQLETDLMDSPGFNQMTGEEQAYIINEYVWDSEKDPDELREIYTTGKVLDLEGGAMDTRIAQVEAALRETSFGADLSGDELTSVAVGIAGTSLREQGVLDYSDARRGISRNARTAVLLQDLAGSDASATRRLFDSLSTKAPARALQQLGRVAYPVDFALNLVGGDGLPVAAGRTGLSALGGAIFVAGGRAIGGAFGTSLGPLGTIGVAGAGGYIGDQVADELFGPG